MRIAPALTALLVLLPAFGSKAARAEVEILPPCSPVAVSRPLTPAQSPPASARSALDSLPGRWHPLARPSARPGPTAPAPVAAASTSGPWERLIPMGWFASTMIVDPVNDRLVVLGGENSVGWTADLWMRSLADSGRWTRIDMAGPKPAAREFGTAIYDPVRRRMILFGGIYSDGVWALSLTGTPAWTRLAPAGSGPGNRQGARAIYDPAGDRMLMFGGYAPPYESDVWAFALGDSTGWTRLSPSGGGPTTRGYGAVVYDSRRHRLLAFSGCDGGANDPQPPSIPDLWALSLDGALEWTQPSASGDMPPGLYFTAAAYDSLHDRMVVYGGTEWNGGSHREAWVLDCGEAPAWTRVAPATSPAPRSGACLGYDARRDRFVMFGGAGSDTWALSLAAEPAWTMLGPGNNEPTPGRYCPSTAWDPVQHQSLILSGYVQSYAEYEWWPFAIPDLWSLNLDRQTRWTHVLSDSLAPYCIGQTMVVNARADRVVVFAGMSRTNGRFGGLTEMSLANPRQWSPLTATGDPPPARDFHSAIYDPLRARMIVFAGREYSELLGDTWMLSLDGAPRWTRTDSVAAAPAPRYAHNAIYDPVGDRMIVFGGATGWHCFGDLWQLSLAGAPAWTPLAAGAGPSPRAYASMVYDSRRQRIVLVGGRSQDGRTLNDMWFLPLAHGAVWTRADSTSFPPGPRWGAAASYDPDRDAVVLAWGTDDPCNIGCYDDAWIMQSPDPVPAEVAASVLGTNPWEVELSWRGLPVAGFTGAVERRTGAIGWSELATVNPDAIGTIDFADHTAQPGLRYGYRLRWSSGVVAGTSAEQWVNVARLRFALACTNASPSREGLSVAFSLPDNAPAQVAVFDIAGRQLVRREVGSLGPGDHAMELAARGTLRPGIYLARIRRGGDSITKRTVVLK